MNPDVKELSKFFLICDSIDVAGFLRLIVNLGKFYVNVGVEPVTEVAVVEHRQTLHQKKEIRVVSSLMEAAERQNVSINTTQFNIVLHVGLQTIWTFYNKSKCMTYK